MVPHTVNGTHVFIINKKKRFAFFLIPKKARKKMKVHKTKEIFVIVENEENKEFRIVVGQSVVSQRKFKTLQQAKDYIAQKPYELIFTTMCVILDNYKQIFELQQPKKEQEQ